MRPLVFAQILFIAAVAATGQTAPRSTLRVGVWTLWHDHQASVKSGAGASLRTCETCRAQPFENIAIQTTGNGLEWTDQHERMHSATVLLLTGSYRLEAHGESLTLTYPLEISAHSGALQLVTVLPVERYVELVVTAESGAADGPESRKGLAIVARSYALQLTHGHTRFDVCDSTHCQWVRWRSTPEAHAAALATAGEVLWFHGSRAAAYFHQNCGGRTAAAEEVWPQHNSTNRTGPGVLLSHSDLYCQRVGSSEWSTTLSRSELTQALAAAGLAASGWKSITVAQRGESGRASVLSVGANKILAEDFRLAVGRTFGWNRIRSNWFEVAAQGDGFLFHGRGSGHGVGLCQAGAAEMGREGYSYHEILAQYFPKDRLGEETTGDAWTTSVGPGFIFETSEATNSKYLPTISRALTEAESRSGLHSSTVIAVRAYRSTPAFRDATLAQGWVAAFTEGDFIALQPMPVLALRKLLDGVLRHEFLHALVEEQDSAHTPLWLREGLVEVWSGENTKAPTPVLTLKQIDQKLAHSASESESEAAHQAAGWYAAQLLTRYGRVQVLAWLRSSVPQSVLVTLR